MGSYIYVEGKWLGDNLSTLDHCRISIVGIVGTEILFQVPMVRSESDICGFGGTGCSLSWMGV